MIGCLRTRVVVDTVFIVAPIICMEFAVWSLICSVIICVISGSAVDYFYSALAVG